MKALTPAIQIFRDEGQLRSVSVFLPARSVRAGHEHLRLESPLLQLSTIAINEADAITAGEESVACFCVIAERFGQGLEKELQTLGWHCQFNDPEGSSLKYPLTPTNRITQRIARSCDNYLSANLTIKPL